MNEGELQVIFEYIDVQWTVISESSVQRIFALMGDRAKAAGWIVDAKFKDASDAVLLSSAQWPSETFGSASYLKDGSSGKHDLFWSTYTRSGLTKVTGGLYIDQYKGLGDGFRRACHRALEDLLTLFNGDDVLCVVLTFEDDEIDIAPGIVGCYRPSLWSIMSATVLDGLEQTMKNGWVEVCPLTTDAEPETVFVIRDDTRASLTKVQASLSAKLWGSPI